MKEKLTCYIDDHLEEFAQYAKYLYDHPEVGNIEFQAMSVLSEALCEKGFEVAEAYIVPTGFIATYKSKIKGPTIAYLCEYDALPEIGHGCGHNLIAAMSLAAGCALKTLVDEIGGEVRVIGTPAEENFGGKVSMAKAHVFDDIDVAMMIHPDTEDGVGARTLALLPLKFELYGVNAHGCHPQYGKSALDAAVLTYQSISMMRQYGKANTYIHGILSHGGEAANVIPAYAAMEYYFRGETMAYVKEVSEKAIRCLEGACIATGCTYKVSTYECPYDNCVINYTLADALKEEFHSLGRKDVKPINEIPCGSSDIGSVSYCCPTLHGYIKIAEADVAGHSLAMASATISKAGTKALRDGSIALAALGIRLILDKNLLSKTKAEFSNAIKKEKQR